MVVRRFRQKIKKYSFASLNRLKIKKNSLNYKIGKISSDPVNRMNIIFYLIFFLFFLAIIFRLFYLQIVKGEFYKKEAFSQQYQEIIIPAKRGEIFSQNSKNGQLSKLATNISLDLVYIDPNFVENKEKVSKELAEILFTSEDYINCKENIKLCPKGNDFSFGFLEKGTGEILGKTDVEIKDKRSFKELAQAYSEDIYKKINKKYNDYNPIKYSSSDIEIKLLKNLKISGLENVKGTKITYIDPTKIDPTKINQITKELLIIFPKKSMLFFQSRLKKRLIQYIPLKKKLSLKQSAKIVELKEKSYKSHLSSDFINSIDKKGNKIKKRLISYDYKGVVLIKEHFRFYPENSLAANVIGYVDKDGIGNYGVEEFLNKKIAGQNGKILNKKNIKGEFMFFNQKNSVKVQDGDSIVLSIDKIIQREVEKILKNSVEKFNADAGQIMVMNPKNGDILSMANYPRFNPNDYGNVYKIVPIKEFIPSVELEKNPYAKPLRFNEGTKLYYTKPVFVKNKDGNFVRFYADEAKEENKIYFKLRKENRLEIENFKRKQKYVYKNRFGFGNFKENNVVSAYEPGSVFKSFSVAIGLDSKEIEPFTKYKETGPIEIDTGTKRKQFIRTAEGIYRGIQTITNAIENSSNIGLAFVARKLGAELFYDYLINFNFSQKFGIEISGEQSGRMKFWRKWNEANLLTTSFGQGISTTPLQIIVGLSALANGGELIQPRLVKKIIKANGEEKIIKKKVIKRVISKPSSAKITSILVSAIENGVARNGRVEGYKLAGKTGTSQIPCGDKRRCIVGTYEKKFEGNFITSFGGYGPAENPKFVILVKLDRPRIGPNTFGSNTAAIVFSEVSKFLLEYFEIEKRG